MREIRLLSVNWTYPLFQFLFQFGVRFIGLRVLLRGKHLVAGFLEKSVPLRLRSPA